MKHGEFDADNMALLSVGRHFRLSEKARLVVGRDEGENNLLESLVKPGDIVFELTDHEGPTSLLRGETGGDIIKLAAGITAYHTKFRHEASVGINYLKGSKPDKMKIPVKPAEKEDIEPLRI